MTAAVIASSLVSAAIYLQVSLGWVVVYRATKVLNFATGQFLLFGTLIYTTLTKAAHLPPLLALVIAALVNAIVAASSYEVLLRRLAGRPVFSQVIVTVGLAIILTSIMNIIWGTQPRALPAPVSERVFHVGGGAVFSTLDLVIIGISLVLFVALLLFLQHSLPGRQMRAAAELPLLASQSGVNINRIFRLAWAIAGVALAVAGIGYAYLTLVSPNIADLGLAGIAPALIGGLDDVRGAIIGSIVLALVENLSAVYINGSVQQIAPYIVILIVLAIRPYGLFGVQEVRRV
jgi:branched-chain amino acid transport system permease protein